MEMFTILIVEDDASLNKMICTKLNISHVDPMKVIGCADE